MIKKIKFLTIAIALSVWMGTGCSDRDHSGGGNHDHTENSDHDGHNHDNGESHDEGHDLDEGHDSDGGHSADDGHGHNEPPTTDSSKSVAHGNGSQYTSAYVCPMHCEGSGSNAPGECPKCFMEYETFASHVRDKHNHR